MNTEELLRDSAAIINKEIINQLELQGHLFLEEIIESVNNGTRVRKFKNKTELNQYAVKYLLKMEEGTPPSEISQNRHIAALTVFYQKLGFDAATAAQKAAVLTMIHLREGSPSAYSIIHSKTGLRKYFMREAFENTNPIVDQKMERGMDEIFLNEFNKQKTERI